MVKCKDCKHWDDPEGFESLRRQHVGLLDPRRHCNKITDENLYALTLPVVRDTEEYCAALWTPPDFGCALGEPRDGSEERKVDPK